ncbi:unnamed protein product [Lasius platythorax]|uniref:Uncharacterized protein n=1 Tax=Lasius platythorax TaxID=488582 RepID=A0AAV2N329_9HYME
MAGEPRSPPVRELRTVVLSIALCLAVQIAVAVAHGQRKHLSRRRNREDRGESRRPDLRSWFSQLDEEVIDTGGYTGRG